VTIERDGQASTSGGALLQREPRKEAGLGPRPMVMTGEHEVTEAVNDRTSFEPAVVRDNVATLYELDCGISRRRQSAERPRGPSSLLGVWQLGIS
jgi:hypothetical protein